MGSALPFWDSSHRRAWNLRLLFAPSSSSSQHGKERETSLTADFPDCQIPRPYRSPHGSRLSSLYCIHRIVASPAALPPRTHSFNRCIHLCRYPARPSSVHIRTLHQPTSLQSHPPKLINQLDAALFVQGQGCLQRTCMESNSIIHPFTFPTPALFYTITSRPSTLSKQLQLYQ